MTRNNSYLSDEYYVKNKVLIRLTEGNTGRTVVTN